MDHYEVKEISYNESKEEILKKRSELEDGSQQPSYTGLLTFPYDVICRRRLVQKRRRFQAQINREINHIIASKMRAIDGIRLDLAFTIQE